MFLAKVGICRSRRIAIVAESLSSWLVEVPYLAELPQRAKEWLRSAFHGRTSIRRPTAGRMLNPTFARILKPEAYLAASCAGLIVTTNLTRCLSTSAWHVQLPRPI